MEFRKATIKDIPIIEDIIERAKKHMHENGIMQWNEYYPTKEDYLHDLDAHSLYVGLLDSRIVCVYTVDKKYEPEYDLCTWRMNDYMVLHRLCIDPFFQHKGLAKECMHHIFKTCKGSIRLDVYTCNPYAFNLYKNLGFVKVGSAKWFEKDFDIMEKVI